MICRIVYLAFPSSPFGIWNISYTYRRMRRTYSFHLILHDTHNIYYLRNPIQVCTCAALHLGSRDVLFGHPTEGSTNRNVQLSRLLGLRTTICTRGIRSLFTSLVRISPNKTSKICGSPTNPQGCGVKPRKVVILASNHTRPHPSSKHQKLGDGISKVAFTIRLVRGL